MCSIILQQNITNKRPIRFMFGDIVTFVTNAFCSVYVLNVFAIPPYWILWIFGDFVWSQRIAWHVLLQYVFPSCPQHTIVTTRWQSFDLSHPSTTYEKIWCTRLHICSGVYPGLHKKHTVNLKHFRMLTTKNTLFYNKTS